jgi:hypothetical protein
MPSTTAVHVWVDTTTPGLAACTSPRDGNPLLVRTLELSVPGGRARSGGAGASHRVSLQALAEGTAG